MLAKTWQILLKGLAEVQAAPNAQSAAEMVLIRLSYAADLPDPSQLMKTLKDMPKDVQAGASAPTPSAGGSAPASSSSGGASGGVPESVQAPIEAPRAPRGDGPRAALAVVPEVSSQPIIAVKTLEDVVLILEQHDEMLLASNVYQYAHLVKIAEGLLEIRTEEQAPPKLASDLTRALSKITDTRWMVSISSAPGEPTLAQKQEASIAAEREEIINMPIIKDILDVFPDAEIKAINKITDNKE